jgi:hypothetical protein
MKSDDDEKVRDSSELTTTVSSGNKDAEPTAVYSDAERARFGLGAGRDLQETEIRELPVPPLAAVRGERGERGQRGHPGPRGHSRTLPLVLTVAGLSVTVGMLLGSCSWFQ